MLITYNKLGRRRGGVPRLWLENHRLAQLGFTAQTPISITRSASGVGVTLRPTSEATRNRVSSRQVALISCPVIDINHSSSLQPLNGYDELKVAVSQNQITVTPSHRAFNIRQHREQLRWPTLELAAGGGTMSEAIMADPRFDLQYAVEIDKRYSSCWAKNHPDLKQTLVHADMRDFDPLDIPPMAYIHASLPCNCYSHVGVAKKGLKDQRELGDSGDLFMDYLRIVKAHSPICSTIECVDQFFTSMAGQLVIKGLQQAGYDVTLVELLPWAEWNEPQDRRRTFLVATLGAKFYPTIPNIPFTRTLGAYLDAPDPLRDEPEAKSMVKMIAGCVARRERNRAKGNGFSYTTINHGSGKVATLLRSLYKVNAGPFIETPYGLRMPRSAEVARLMGASEEKFTQFNYATNIQLLGQGVQTRIFKQLINQIGDFMAYHVDAWRAQHGGLKLAA